MNIKQINDNTGVGAFATSKLSAGVVIDSVDQPLLVALDFDRLADTCYECYRREGDTPVEIQLGFSLCPIGRRQNDIVEVKLSRCAGCKVVKYCGKTCQRSSWKAHHALECPIFKTLHPRHIPNHVRAVLRLLLLRKAGRVQEDDWTSLMACSSHNNEYSQTTSKQQLAELQQNTKAIMMCAAFEVEEDLILGILMRLSINSLTLQTPYHDPLGLVLHPLLAKINHSCDPNCYIRFSNKTLVPNTTISSNTRLMSLTSLRKITADEQLTISYVDETMPTRYRRQELQDRYFFACDCSRCTAEDEQAKKLDPDVQMKMYSIQDQARALLGQFVGSTTDHGIHIRHLTSQIHGLFLHDKDWPLVQYPFPQLLHQLILTYIDNQNFQLAFPLAALLHRQVDPGVYSSPIHPLRLTHTMLLIKLTGTALDASMSDVMELSDNNDMAELSLELDLGFWYSFLIEKLVLTAADTWHDQPWPWMKDQIRQRQSTQRYPHDTIKVEEVKMHELCSKTLDMLKTQRDH